MPCVGRRGRVRQGTATLEKIVPPGNALSSCTTAKREEVERAMLHGSVIRESYQGENEQAAAACGAASGCAGRRAAG